MMNITSISANNYQAQTPSFKSQKPSTFVSLAARGMTAAKKTNTAYNNFIENVLAKRILAPILNTKLAGKLIDKSAKVNDMTSYMSTAGSVVTTGVYANRTLNNKNLDKKAAKTLALNQGLVLGLSTVGAFTINDSIAKFTKKMSYKFRDLNKDLPSKVLEKRFQGFSIAQKLLTFSLMYRYISPVLVTPIASKISKSLNNNAPVAAKAGQPAAAAKATVATVAQPAAKAPVVAQTPAPATPAPAKKA